MNMVQILQTSPLFSGTTSDEIAQLLSCLEGRTSDFARDRAIIEEGNHTDELGIVLKGRVHITRHDFWGNRSLVTEVAVGGSFAEALACTTQASEVSVVAAEQSTILFLNIHKVITSCARGCIFHHTLIENMVRLLSQRNLDLLKKIDHLTKRSTRDKLLSYLNSESKRQQSRTFTIPFDRQQLADYLCVERSAMSTELSRMQADGLVEYQRREFTLHHEEY
jgi:CRP-like cAMP-binding protein